MLSPDIAKIIDEAKAHKKTISVIAFFGVIYAVSSSRVALYVKDIFDQLNKGDIANIQRTCLYVLGLSLVAAVSRYFHIYLMNYVAEQIGQQYRQKLLSHFMRLNLTFHNQFQTGSGGMLSRVLADASMIQTGLRMIADIFLHPVLLIMLLGNLFYLDWKLTLSLFVIVPVLVLFLRSISRSLKKYVPMGQTHLERMTSTIKEALDGVRIIQSYNLEDYIDEKLKSQSDEYLAARKKVHSRIEIAGPVTEFVATTLVIVVLIYTTMEIAAGRATPGDFMGFVTSLLMLNQPIKKIQENFVRLQEVMVAARRVYSITEDLRTVPEPSDPVPFPKDWKLIEFKDISFSYGDKEVLSQVSFTVRRGERVAFVGESGSGKSTLINLLPRFYDPTQGTILIDQIPLDRLKVKDLRRHISLVSQDVFLFQDSIETNVRAGDLSAVGRPILSSIQSANAVGFVSKLKEGEKTGVGDRGALLSGGEKQRISIARAIFKDAPILILDEATSALDSSNEREVQKGLDDAMEGRTSLIVAHRLSTIQNVDRIYVMQKGSIVESGSHIELMNKKGLYYSFVKMQESSSSS